MATSNLKAKYLLLLQEPFNLDIPYADRQRVVIVADAQVEAERKTRTRAVDLEAFAPYPVLAEPPVLGDALEPADLEPAGDESPAAAFGRQLMRGLREINRDVGNDLRRNFRDVRHASTDFKRSWTTGRPGGRCGGNSAR
jgi:hypothetical protein